MFVLSKNSNKILYKCTCSMLAKIINEIITKPVFCCKIIKTVS